MNKSVAIGILFLAFLCLPANPALANKSAVFIEGPTSAAKGTEVTLFIKVTHNANTSSHHTEWLKVTANKKEIARWNFTKENLPEAAEFTKEVITNVTEDTEIVAEASCNRHGSKGPVMHKVKVK
jgi:desulfoferrodoxin (superoxide reductase-like protein)